MDKEASENKRDGSGETAAAATKRPKRGPRRGGHAHHLAARFRASRKRPHTAKFFLPHKRTRKDAFIPPTKFLLGGNISDPLNLNSLQDEDVNRAMNAVTPESSPLPTPPRHKAKIDVIIPPDVRDPLNLLHTLSDDEYEKQLEQRRPKKRPRIRRHFSESCASEAEQRGEPSSPPKIADTSDSTPKSLSHHKEGKKPRRQDSMDKIVSPVVPQPGAWMRARPARPQVVERPVTTSTQPVVKPKFNPKNEKYQYGNYDRYYGYRNACGARDVRLDVLAQHRHLLLNKDVLDIGCNVGHVTIAVARDLGARSATGVDIDAGLIERARRSLASWVSVPCETIPEQPNNRKGKKGKKSKKNRKAQDKFYFPASFAALYGGLEPPPPAAASPPPAPPTSPAFPHNVSFKQENYVRSDWETPSASGAPLYDVILCLSTTKWLHLNFGDAGLKLAFRRMFAELRPGGKLVLEPQSWPSYARRKRLTERIYNNYNSIEFHPERFRDYLLSPEVGFSKCCVLGVPRHSSKGFRRPLHLYVKGDFTPSKAQWSDAYVPASSTHQPDSVPPRRTVYAPCTPGYSPSPANTPRAPLCDAAAPYSPAPHISSPANFLEPSPGRSTYSRAVTPSHATAAASHKYACAPSPSTHQYASVASPSPHQYSASPSPHQYSASPSPHQYAASPSPHQFAVSPSSNQYSPSTHQYAGSPSPNQYASGVSPSMQQCASSLSPHRYVNGVSPSAYQSSASASPHQQASAASPAPHQYAPVASPLANLYAASPSPRANQYSPSAQYASGVSPSAYQNAASPSHRQASAASPAPHQYAPGASPSPNLYAAGASPAPHRSTSPPSLSPPTPPP